MTGLDNDGVLRASAVVAPGIPGSRTRCAAHGDRFDAACDRWRSLYRAALEDQAEQNRRVLDHATTLERRRQAQARRADAEHQLRLLKNEDSETRVLRLLHLPVLRQSRGSFPATRSRGCRWPPTCRASASAAPTSSGPGSSR